MLTAEKFKTHCAQLVNPFLPPDTRKELATEVRDSIELVHSQDYNSFLTHFLPAFKTVLTSLTKPQQVDNVVHQVRAIILEILHRLPHNETLRAKFLEVFALAMQILRTDNEENAITAIHIIFDLHKNYRHHLGSQVEPFLDFVRLLYESFPAAVKSLLLTKRPPDPAGQTGLRRMATSSQSFKVMTESPLLVMFVFQLYPVYIKTHAPRLVPLMIRAIEVDLPAHSVAAAPKAAFHEFVAAQIKTVSFLAYLLRKHRDWMKADDTQLARSVVKLFQSCPADAASIRKDLLVASRHMLQTFHHGFLSELDLLLDPKVLLGTGRAALRSRPFAYLFLAEVIHPIRSRLSFRQNEKIILIFSTNLHDPTFSYSIQISAVRLLLNLIDSISKGDINDANRNTGSRELLLRILRTMVAKYKTLGDQVPRLLKSIDELRSRPNPLESGERLCEVMVGDPMKEIVDFKSLLKTLTHGLKTVIWAAINSGVSDSSAAKGSGGPSGPSSNADTSFAPQPNAPSGRKGVRAGLLEKECETIAQLLEAGQKCFRLYSHYEDKRDCLYDVNDFVPAQNNGDDEMVGADGFVTESDPDFAFLGSGPKVSDNSIQEEKDIFDLFAQIFKVLDIRSFQDIFGLRMGDLFEHVVENPAALIIPQQFLANDNISKYFADILLNFLVDNLAVLDVPLPQTAKDLTQKEKIAQSLLKLFKILFASVSFFPTNEPVLRLHIGSLVRKCLKHAATAKDPHNYLQMLRALFKTLTKSKGQFELLYREFMPLVEPLLNGLLALYQGPNRLAHSDLIVELCLMIPARPSTIFPYLDLQIKPIVWSLQGGTENVQYGLRTLEFWVDMLQPEYLERLLARVDPDLSMSMYRLLRVSQSRNTDPAATTLRILGKLGSRARCNRALQPSFETGPESRSVQKMPLTWPDKSNATLQTDTLVQLSVDGLLNRRKDASFSNSTEYKTEAWMFLYSCLCPFIGLTSDTSHLPSTSSMAPTLGVWSTSGSKSASDSEKASASPSEPHKTKQQRASETSMVKDILVALIGTAELVHVERLIAGASGKSSTFPAAKVCVADMSRYFALLTVQQIEKEAEESYSSQTSHVQLANDHSEGSMLSHDVFLDAVTSVMSLEDRTLCQSGLESLQAYVSGLFDYSITTTANALGNESGGQTARDGVLSDGKTNETPGDSEKVSIGNGKIKSPQSRADNSVQVVSPTKSNVVKPLEIKGEEVILSKGPQVHPTGTAKVQPDVEMADAKKGLSDEKMEARKNQKGMADEHIFSSSLAPIVDRLCHCCYQKRWNAKWAGAYGLGMLVDGIADDMFSSSYFARNIIYMVRALMFVIRDASAAIEDEIVARGRTILRKLLKTCFTRGKTMNSTGKSLPSELSKVLREATVRLTIDLSCDSSNARETARQCLRVLGKTLNRDVADILSHDYCKEQLLRPLMQRSVRQHPFPTQIGFIDAMIFCLQLERALLKEELFSAPLTNVFLNEVIAVSEDPTFEKLTEAEEGIRSKLVENKMIHTGVAKDLLVLRRKAVELLCSVVVNCSSTLLESRNDALFRNIISSLFKNLQSRDKDIVDSAKLGLKQAIADHPKPKDLLQRNLRPILSNLGDYQRLTMQYVEGLSRVLELFSHWFNVNLGEKLLEHLHRWLEPENLVHLKRWAPGTEARVGAAVLNLFHLLPPTASKFLEKIVLMVIQLESVLAVAGPGVAHLGLKSAKAASTSPYREPLLKYCNQHAAVAAKYFLHHLESDSKRQLFFVMLRSTESLPLRKELMENPKRLVSPTLLSVDGMGTKSLHIITLIDLLSRHDPCWLGKDPDLIAKLSSYWKTASCFSDSYDSAPSSLGQVQEVETLANIFIRYCLRFEKEVSILFVLLTVFSARTTCDFTFVKDFLHAKVTKPSPAESRSTIMVNLFSLFQDKTAPQDRKVHALQYIVIPMLEYHLESRRMQTEDSPAAGNDKSLTDPMDVDRSGPVTQGPPNKDSGKRASSSNDSGNAASLPSAVHRGEAPRSTTSELKLTASGGSRSGQAKEEPTSKDTSVHLPPDRVLNAPMIQRVMVELFDQPDEILRHYNEPLSAELLRLATLLIRYMPGEVGRYRKELIKFGWNHLKREDSIAKQCAFVNVSRFFEAYQAPDKIILQVFVALLRACQGEGKELVQEALDILTPALPHQLEHNPAVHKYPLWIRYTKKILLEEGHSAANLVHIWHLIARHASLFYVARAQFVPIMVNSLSRIGLSASANAESRRLTLDLVDLIIRWEQTRRQNMESNSLQDMDGDPQHSGQNGSRKRAREEETKSSITGEDSLGGTERSHVQSNEPPAKTRRSEGSHPIPECASPNKPNSAVGLRDTEDFKPTTAMTDVLIQFLVQIPFRGLDRRDYPLVTKRCIMLLKQASALWPGSTARLAFLGKFLEAPNGDKPSTKLQHDSKKISNQGSQSMANQSMDGKSGFRGELPQAERGRSGARHAALSAALGVAIVLTKCQGRRFVKENVSPIRDLIVPAVAEGDVRMAGLFASLLKELVRLWPPPSSVNVDMDISKPKMKQSKGHPSKSASKVDGSVPVTKSADLDKVTSKGDDRSEKTLGQAGDLLMKPVYNVIHDAIDGALKSSDLSAQHCGLQVLKVFSDYSPQECLRYQEMLVKGLQRMTREKVNAAQQAISSNAGSTPSNGSGNRSSGGKDRGNVGTPIQAHGKISTGSEQLPNDAGRRGKSPAAEEARKRRETQVLILYLSLVGDNMITLEQNQKKATLQCIVYLIERCVDVDVLLEVVRIAKSWVVWKPRKEVPLSLHKEALTSKEKVQLLLKMGAFERSVREGSDGLMKAYLSIVLAIFAGRERRPELLPRLERAFMYGMKAGERSTRQQFFQIYNASIAPSLSTRLIFLLAKQDWEHLSDSFWIKHAAEVLISATEKDRPLQRCIDASVFPAVVNGEAVDSGAQSLASEAMSRGRRGKVELGDSKVILDPVLLRFYRVQKHIRVRDFVDPLQALLHYDSEIAHHVWVDLFSKTWAMLNGSDKAAMERSILTLLSKEYHLVQASWPRNTVQALLDAFVKCTPMPHIRADLIFHLGSRWNAWHTALRFLQLQEDNLKAKLPPKQIGSDDKADSRIRNELEDVADARAELYRLLHERDFLAGSWKVRAKSPLTKKALVLEQVAKYSQAQNVYGTAMSLQLSTGSGFSFRDEGSGLPHDQPGKAEVCLWEERWIDCARKLCQWEVLTEFARVVVNTELLHECLWRIPDWSALKELLIKNPVEEGPQLKLYQAYMQLQENKLDVADSYIQAGYERSLKRYCALPESWDLDAYGPIFVQFQQLVELQESRRILSELNALSRHGNTTINVEQKIDNVRLILNTWRERLPSQHESLTTWNDILTWRNHVHAVVVNVLEALKEAASAKVAAAQNAPGNGGVGNRNANSLHAQTPQVQAAAAIAQALPQQVLVMGVNETAWSVHRFAKACRKQGFPDMALYALQKLYPFGTMELTEYFVKTKETAKSFMAQPLGIDNSTKYGLHELNKCNMDHFNSRQKAQLFTVRGKLCAALGKEVDAVDAFTVALSTSSDVSSAWLAWGLHCDAQLQRLSSQLTSAPRRDGIQGAKTANDNKKETEAALEWREAAVNCYLQAVRFGSRKSRLYLPRVLRLLTTDVYNRVHLLSQARTDTGEIDSSKVGSVQTKSNVSHTDRPGAPNSTPPNARSLGKATSVPPSQPNNWNAATQPSLSEGVARVISGLLTEIPAWMWIPWIPQLVPMLCRREANVVRPLLVRVAQQYPQAAFFPVRAFMEDRKPIDRPDKILSKDALKMGRPITSALLPNASSAQANAPRQIQILKGHVQRAHQRYEMIQKALQRIESAINASQGTSEHAANVAKKNQLKKDLVHTHQLHEKCMQEYAAAQQRQRQALEHPSSGSGDTGADTQKTKKQNENPSLGQLVNTKPDMANAPGAGETSKENRRADWLQKKREGRDEGDMKKMSMSQSDRAGGTNASVLRTPFAHADYVMAHVVKSHQLVYLEVERIALELAYRLKPQKEEHLLSLMNALLHRCYQNPVKMGKEVATPFRSALEEVSRMCFLTGNPAPEKPGEHGLQSGIADLKEAFEAELAPQTAKDFPSEIEPFIARLRRWQGIFQRRVRAMPDYLNLESASKHLIEISHSDVEVFGQYVDIDIAEPNISRHVKIERFSADVRVVRRHSGPSRGIRVIGSDGKLYDFLLEASINASIQSTEDRTAQTFRLLNTAVFAKDSEAHRRRIQLTVPTFVVIGARSRLVSDDPSLSSLADGLEHYLESNKKKIDDPLMAFRTLASEAYNRRRANPGKETTRAESIAARVDAYHAVCDSQVPASCFSEWVRSRMPTATSDFNFRKRFSETLGATSLVYYSLAIGARRPQNILFSWASGTIHNVHMRGLISGRGILESDEAVPFRLTRNLQGVMGPFGLEGPFYGSMIVTLESMAQNFGVVRLFLDLIMRDELSGWLSNKADAGRGRKDLDGGGGRERNDFKVLEDCLAASMHAVGKRLKCKQPSQIGHSPASQKNVEEMAEYVGKLIGTASKPENLAQMESSWQAWY